MIRMLSVLSCHNIAGFQKSSLSEYSQASKADHSLADHTQACLDLADDPNVVSVKPSISSHSKPRTMACTRLLICFVLQLSVIKTKHLRSLV